MLCDHEPVTAPLDPRLPDGGGYPVDVYTLTNKQGLEARVTNYGGIILSLRVPDRDGRFDDACRPGTCADEVR